MTRLEYKKIQVATRKKSRDLLDKIIAADVPYPSDLHYLWEFMQANNMGLRICLGYIYSLGYLDCEAEKESKEVQA